MAKSLQRLEARKLRRKGISVKKIAQHLGVTKGSVSLWVRDIILSIEQLEILRGSRLEGAEKGRLKSALLQKQRRLKRIEQSNLNGHRLLQPFLSRDLLVAGIALYWGEGCKRKRNVELCNSDPKLIQFFITWLIRCFDVRIEELKCAVGINEIHKVRDDHVKKYWSEITDIPLDQFRRTSFKRVANKKVYENFNEHYGTLSVHVSNPAQLYYKIMGLIDGLHLSLKEKVLPEDTIFDKIHQHGRVAQLVRAPHS